MYAHVGYLDPELGDVVLCVHVCVRACVCVCVFICVCEEVCVMHLVADSLRGKS